MAEEKPDRYVANMSKAKRRGKIFIDYLRNQRSSTAIAPYSTRARPGAHVALPMTWQALARADERASCKRQGRRQDRAGRESVAGIISG